MPAQSLTEALTEAARTAAEASNWERDQQAWNLPRAQGETGPDEAENDAGKGEPGEPGDAPRLPETDA